MTYRSKMKMINTTLIALLLLHLFPTGPPYNPTCQTNCRGNCNSSIFKKNSKTMNQSTAIKIPNTMKQTPLKGVNQSSSKSQIQDAKS